MTISFTLSPTMYNFTMVYSVNPENTGSGGGGGVVYSLDFSKAQNSMYLVIGIP